jgi:hypothetical protein
LQADGRRDPSIKRRDLPLLTAIADSTVHRNLA